MRYQNGEFKSWRVRDGLAAENIHGLVVDHPGEMSGSRFASRFQRFRNGVFETIDLPTGTRYLRAMADGHRRERVGRHFRRQPVAHPRRCGDRRNRTHPGWFGIHSLPVRHVGRGAVDWLRRAGGGGAGGGIARFKDGKYARFTTREGLHDNFISQIVADKCDRLWLAGNGGIFRSVHDRAFHRWPMTSPMAARRGCARSFTAVRRDCPACKALMTRFRPRRAACDGRIWMAMRTGLAVVHTENIRDNPERRRCWSNA